MEKMKLQDTEEPLKSKIEKEILRVLDDRIVTTVFNSMTEENVAEFEMIKGAYPEFTNFQAVWVIVDKIPALRAAMIKGINDLAEELTYDTAKLDEVLKEKSQNKK